MSVLFDSKKTLKNDPSRGGKISPNTSLFHEFQLDLKEDFERGLIQVTMPLNFIKLKTLIGGNKCSSLDNNNQYSNSNFSRTVNSPDL